MSGERLSVLVILDPDPKALRRLLQRHRVLAVALVIEAEGRRVSAIARHYGAKPLSLPPELLLDRLAGGRGG